MWFALLMGAKYLAQMRAVTDFVLEHCTEDQTVYINMDSNGYSGTTFAYSLSLIHISGSGFSCGAG